MFSMDGNRVRKILHRSMPRTMGRFASRKCGRMVHFESQLERDFFYQLEFDPVVIRFLEQPIKVQLCYQGKNRNYTPDVAVERPSGVTFYEVKPHRKAIRPEMEELFEAAAQAFAALGHQYSVVTDREIQREPFLQNIKLLFRYADQLLLDDKVAACRSWLLQHGPVPIAEFAAAFGGPIVGLHLAYCLIANRFATAPLNTERLGPNVVIAV